MPRTRAQDRQKAQHRLLEAALRAFEEVTGAGTGATATLGGAVGGEAGAADAEMTLADGTTFLVEAKSTLNEASVGPVLARQKRLGRPVLLVTPYVNPSLGERLKAMDAFFLDQAGNAYLRTARSLIYVTGRKPQKETGAAKPVRAFRPIGLRALFAVLARPELLNAPYREIAAQAGVALGTVSGVLNDLERLGYLTVSKAGGRRFQRRPQLLEAWVEAYHRELRPRLNVRRFRVAQADWWKTEGLGELDLWLGGEAAAALLTEHLRPDSATLYGGADFASLARKLHPAKDEQGNLELLERFWDFDSPEYLPGRRLVPPLLVYADLLGTGDARNRETAEILRERFLA